MEYIEGGSLAEKLDHAPQPPRQAATIAERLAHAVAAAHQAGVVHRDLKPANVLLTPDGTPKITDFGLAKRIYDTDFGVEKPQDEDQGQTRTGALLGTPCYMAPEQALGLTKVVGPAADVYALGVILYEMLTGILPFRGATVNETLEQIKHQKPVPPRRLQPKVPRDLQTICLKCLEKSPARRYSGAASLGDDLKRFLDDKPIRGYLGWEGWDWWYRLLNALDLPNPFKSFANLMCAYSVFFFVLAVGLLFLRLLGPMGYELDLIMVGFGSLSFLSWRILKGIRNRRPWAIWAGFSLVQLPLLPMLFLAVRGGAGTSGRIVVRDDWLCCNWFI